MSEHIQDGREPDFQLPPINVDSHYNQISIEQFRNFWQYQNTDGQNTLHEVSIIDPDNQPPDENRYKNENKELGAGSINDVASHIFNKIDSNNNGKISEEELSNAVADKSFRGQEAQTVAALYHTFDDVQSMKREFWLPDTGITRGDLKQLDQLEETRSKSLSNLGQAESWLESGFARIDKDGNGIIENKEIASGITDKSLSPGDKNLLSHLSLNSDSIEKLNNDQLFMENGMSEKDIEKHLLALKQESSVAARASYVIGRTSKSQQPEISKRLYGNGQNPTDSIKPDAIFQGTVGNCYLLSSIASVAEQNPEAIKNMIQENKDGTYTVTFADGKDKPITVEAPTEAELGLYNNGSKYGVWASVIEKAYGLHRVDTRELDLRKRTAVEKTGGGGWPKNAMKSLTGSDIETSNISSLPGNQLNEQLKEAFAKDSNRAVTATIMPNKKVGDTNRTKDNYPVGHAYTIIDYLPLGADNGVVKIRNPWGVEDGTPNGTSILNLEQFKENFSFINVQKEHK